MREICPNRFNRLKRCLTPLILIIILFSGAAFAIGRSNSQTLSRLYIPANSAESLKTFMKTNEWDKLIATGELIPANSNYHPNQQRLVYQQYYQGFPVVGGRLVIRTDNFDSVVMAHSSLAKWKIKPSLEINDQRAHIDDLVKSVIDLKNIVTEPSFDQVVFPVNGVPVLCWRVKVTLRSPARAMEYYFNAGNGALIHSEDRLYRFEGLGLVFDPDPKSAVENNDLEDNDDDSAAIPVEAYSEAALLDISVDEDTLFVLTGPYADTSPTENRARSIDGVFFYDRANDFFEEVMAYYHIDKQARYLLNLGFDGLPPAPQVIDVNRIEDDVSFFNPHTGVITTGTGGVDDAEDADVLLHEYTHAILERIIPDWRGGDSGLLTEGTCDYFAGDYSLTVSSDFQPTFVYNWDGHNQFWDGRVLDSDYIYPDDCQGEAHDAGQMWSSLLTEVRLTGERDLWNTIILDHLYSLGDSANVPDAAQALLSSDLYLTGGEFRRQILSACERRHIFPPGEYAPIIRHTPIRDTEDIESPIAIIANIESPISLDSTQLLVIYRFGDADPETLGLNRSQEIDHTYIAEIPAPNRETDVSYYIIAADQAGIYTVNPQNAPENQHQFFIGSDRFAPIITEVDSLPDTVFPIGESAFQVTVHDNIALSEVKLIWLNNEFIPQDETILLPKDEMDGRYEGRIRWRSNRDETVHYRVRAIDASERRNIAQSPLRSFTIRSEALVDDFERASHRWVNIGWNRTNQMSFAGIWAMVDRTPEDASTPREAIAEIDEVWDFSGMGHARLLFAENHSFDRPQMERGIIEISDSPEGGWREIYSLGGTQQEWMDREIDLDRWATRDAFPIRLRFRTVTPIDAEPASGWIIDDIRLRVGNAVSVENDIKQPSGILLGMPFPNPANNSIKFSAASDRETVIRLIDVCGRSVVELQLPAGNHCLGMNLAGIPAGIYWLQTDDSNGKIHRIVLLR